MKKVTIIAVAAVTCVSVLSGCASDGVSCLRDVAAKIGEKPADVVLTVDDDESQVVTRSGQESMDAWVGSVVVDGEPVRQYVCIPGNGIVIVSEETS